MTIKQLTELAIAPGIFTEQTDRGAKGRWKSGDKVRFRRGLPEKLGGWEQLAPQFLGVARNILDWSSLDGTLWSAIGTDLKLYLWQSNGTLYDITPLRLTATLTDPFTTVAGQSTVTVTHVGHGAVTNDFVTFSGAAAVGGLTLNGEYQVTNVIDFTQYEIEAASAAGSSATGGSTVFAEYQINTGPTSSTVGSGWGTSTWSADTWGTARTQSTFAIGARTWSLDNWGEDLIANPFGGALYWWDRTNGPNARAVKLEDAPDRSNFAIISQRDRHLFALGSNDRFDNKFDPLLIRWCSQEDLNDWVPTAVNTSGDLPLYSGSKIICGEKTRGEIIVFTDTTVHSLVYLGGSDVYGVNVVGENVSILGPNAVVPVDYRVMFMAEGDFYVYDGVLRVLPCDVRNYVYGRIDFAQKEKVIAGLNREFNEVWWFYPTSSTESTLAVTITAGNPFPENFIRVGYFDGQEVQIGTLDSSETSVFFQGAIFWRDTALDQWNFSVLADNTDGEGNPPDPDIFSSITFTSDVFGPPQEFTFDFADAATDIVTQFLDDAFPEARRWTWNVLATQGVDQTLFGAGTQYPLSIVGSGGAAEITSYVALNYEEGSWHTGELVRTAWADRSPVLSKPYAAGTDGYLYKHETGVDAAGAAMTASLASYDLEIGMGEELVHVDQLVPDFLELEGSVRITFNGRKYPQATALISKGPYVVQPDTRKISTRMRARQVSVELLSDQVGDRWRMGTLRARAGAHGKRG